MIERQLSASRRHCGLNPHLWTCAGAPIAQVPHRPPTSGLFRPGVGGGWSGRHHDLIRQDGATHAAVLIRIVEMLTAVASCEHDPERAKVLQHHADLVQDDAERHISTADDLADLRKRQDDFKAARKHSVPGPFGTST